MASEAFAQHIFSLSLTCVCACVRACVSVCVCVCEVILELNQWFRCSVADRYFECMTFELLMEFLP